MNGASRSALVVTHVFDAAPKAGNERRIYQLVKWLGSQGYQINLAWKAPPARVREMAARVPEWKFFPLWSESRTQAVDLESEICPDWLVERVETLDTLLQPDLLIAEYAFMSRCLIGSHAPLKLIDTHDVFSRRESMIREARIQDRFYLSAAAEAKMLARADALLAIQEQEAALLRSLCPETTVLTCGVDLDFSLRSAKARRSYSAILVASDNPANRAGVDNFLNQIWPAIRRAAPRAKLLLAGGVARAFPRVPKGVTVAGEVADLTPLYAQARVSVNPVQIGTGLKIKSVEALAHGLPLVSFANGLEGLPQEGFGEAFFASENAEQFVAQVLSLSENPKRWDRAAKAARALSRRHFVPEAVYAPLAALLASYTPEDSVFKGRAMEQSSRIGGYLG